MPISLAYAAAGLDRVAERRRSDAWTRRRLKHPDTRIVPVWRNNNLVRVGAEPKAEIFKGHKASRILEVASDVVLLGVDGRVTYFAADLSDFEIEEIAWAAVKASFIDLRQAGPLMRRDEAALMAYARGMMYWHRNHRFCGACGTPTENHHGGHMRVCMRPECGRQHFPRTDPAVIMLVTRAGRGGDACLLGRQAQWPDGMYSTLAGFVEPGETLEEAVAREVGEETGIEVADVTYLNSQPWPFPSSLMLGFRARALTTRIRIAPDELADARWFGRDDLRRMEERGMRLPRADSIARWLVEEWLAEGER